MTLIELVMFIVIVGVGLAGVLSSLNISVKSSADPIQPKQALTIAESLLEEALLKNYSNPPGGYVASCPGTCDRNSFDDIGDFNNYSITPISGYTATVQVAAENTTDLGVTARKITVNVTPPNGQALSLAGFRANY